MFENEKKQVLDAALEIKRCSLVSLSGGNISMRVGEDRYLVTPSGMIYEEMVPDDVCLIECGQSHGFINDSDEELVMMALVYNE